MAYFQAVSYLLRSLKFEGCKEKNVKSTCITVAVSLERRVLITGGKLSTQKSVAVAQLHNKERVCESQRE